MKKTILITLIMFLPFISRAEVLTPKTNSGLEVPRIQEPTLRRDATLPKGFLTIDSSIDKAMKSNAEVLKAEKELEIAKEELRQSKTNFLPTVSAGGLYTHINQEPPVIDFRTIVRTGVMPQIVGNPLLQYAFQDNYDAAFRITEPLFTGGRNLWLYRLSDYQCTIKENELETVKSNLKVEVVRAFYGVMLARETKAVTEEAVDNLKNHLEIVKNFKAEGTAIEYDYLKSESQLYTWELKLTQAGHELKNAIKQLNFLIGVGPDSNIELSGSLDYAAPKDSISVDSEVEKALKDRPELKLAEELSKVNEAEKSVNKSFMMPQLNLAYENNVANKQREFTLGSDAWYNWWDIKLELNWEIFTFGRHRSQIKESELKERYAEINTKDLKDKIKLEVEEAFDAKTESETNVLVAEKNLDVAKKSYQIANDNYNNKTMTNTELLDSHLTMMDAKFQYLKTIYDYKVACAEFERVTGR